MSRRWRGALIGTGIGAFYGLFNASQKYPNEYWNLFEGQVRIGGHAIVFVVAAAVVGYGIASVSRAKNPD